MRLEFSVLHCECLGFFFAFLIFVCIAGRVNAGVDRQVFVRTLEVTF